MLSDAASWTRPEWDGEEVASRYPSESRRPICLFTPPPTVPATPRESPERNLSTTNPSFLCLNKDSKLARQLLTTVKQSAYDRQIKSISRTDLSSLLTIEVVINELKEFGGKRIVKKVAERLITPDLNVLGIFAILVLIKQTSKTFGLIHQTFPTIPANTECGMSDYHLPLVMVYDESKDKVVLRRQDYPEAHLDCFDEFTTNEIVAFEQLQWLVLEEAHVKHGLESGGPTSWCERWHYHYSANDQLPVAKPRRPPNAVPGDTTMISRDVCTAGSNDEVALFTLTDPTRPRAMPSCAGNIHYNCQLVAVKEARNAKDFLSQRRTASLISALLHPHIAPLLFSYSHLEHSYLVFPWATSNLAEYWDKNTLYLQQERSHMEYSRVLWVAEQCEGLADALRYFHRFLSTSSHHQHHQGENAQIVASHHGHIKPESIMVYHSSPDRYPVLQLADFGKSTDTTDFNHIRPSTNADYGAGDYTAPEVYFGEPVSSKSDVWSLCCVFLEFIEWIMPSQSAPGQPKRVLTSFDGQREYVQGREAFKDWRRSRGESGHTDDVTAYFFDSSTGELSLWIDTWLHDAQDNALCSEWMFRFVGYLDESILQQDVGNRISSRALYHGLLDLRMSCQHPMDGRRFAIEPINR